MKQNLMKIPIFAQMEMVLESKKYFKVLGGERTVEERT